MRNFLRFAAILIIILGVLWLAGCRFGKSKPSSPPSSTAPGQPAQAQAVCPLDHEPATPEEISRRPLAVMIENSPQARPQSGLNQACVVYEGITEGGITRFLAIFLHHDPPVIGPVRSARPHFINLAREFDPAYVHCGESYEALQILAIDPSIRDLDQMKFGATFWRDHSRVAPHNLYTSAARLRARVAAQHWDGTPSQLPDFQPGGKMLDPAPATDIAISFGGAVHYSLRLIYDPKAGGYWRYMDRHLHVDRETDQPILVKNVVIERVWDAPFANSKKETYDVEVVGTGRGLFFTGGQSTALLWRKPDIASPTVYSDLADDALPFQPGPTWIELVPLGGSVTILKPAPKAPEPAPVPHRKPAA